MLTADFQYPLPPELIAQRPPPRRDAARLLVVRRATGALEHRGIADLPGLLAPGDLLTANDTRVIPARLYGRKPGTGGRVEVLLIEELADRRGVWQALVRASRSPPEGMELELAGGEIRARVLARAGPGRKLLRLEYERPLLEILDRAGVPPLPPYIRRTRGGADERDRERYQTVFARTPGAIAAPTAGLHFTPELLARLRRRGIGWTALTLHVGPGTFQPVKTAAVEEHRMESERYCVPEQTARRIRAARSAGRRLVAVGTTVVRTLETVAREHGAVVAAAGRSDLFIYPPFAFRVVDALLTNFHLPASTLLMLVSAFAGRELIRRAYAEAIRAGYRFYSYGDCMLVI